MGYGYGVWYLVRNKNIDDFIRTNNQTSHIAHITVMCHMDKKEAIKLYNYLKHQIYKEELFIPITPLADPNLIDLIIYRLIEWL